MTEEKRRWEVGTAYKFGPESYEDVVLPADEGDEHWDAKMRNPVPEHLIAGLEEFDWDPSMQAVAVEEGGKLHLRHGKTRWRALAAANKRRAKRGWPGVTAHVLVTSEDGAEQMIYNMRRNVRLNRHVQEIDPMTLAESMFRSLSAGVEERQVADDHAVTVNEMHGHLLFLDEDKCPPAVQELLRSKQISAAAATELARQSEKRTKAETLAAAEQIAKMAAGGARVTTAQVKRAAGVAGENGPATNRDKKKLVLELYKAELKGPHGEAAKLGAVLALEVGLGTRTVADFWEAIDKVAKGKGVKVDLRQYGEPVKGQEK